MVTYVDPKLLSAWNKVISDAAVAGIDWDEIESVTFDRAEERLGCCHWNHKKKNYKITISSKLKPERYESVLMHELCHAKDGVYGHGKEWKLRAQKVNKLGYDICRCGSIDELSTLPKYKYKISCTKCNHFFYRIRKSDCVKHPESYYCPYCHGKFKVEMLD